VVATAAAAVGVVNRPVASTFPPMHRRPTR